MESELFLFETGVEEDNNAIIFVLKDFIYYFQLLSVNQDDMV